MVEVAIWGRHFEDTERSELNRRSSDYKPLQ